MRTLRARGVLAAVALCVSTCACGRLPGDSPAVATSVAATIEAMALPSPPAHESPEALGRVTGTICYPSESPPAMTAYFDPVAGGDPVRLAIAPGQNSYEVSLPAGEYLAYAWVWTPEFQLGGSYSRAVPCGLGVGCTDHSLLPIVVSTESLSTGIDLCDWTGGAGSIPTPPGVALSPPPATASAPGGLSLNCDGSSQRVRNEDAGPAGRTVAVDAWLDGDWVSVWSVSGGDPMIQQIEPEAGARQFGGCRSLIVVPFRYSGSGADLRLEIFAWDGAGMRQVYSHSGTKGAWSTQGDRVQFKEAKFLYGEPNCCPCATQTTEHTWDGNAFVETRVVVEPTYSGTPPEYCNP